MREKQWRHDSMSDVEEGQALEEEQEEVRGYYILCANLYFVPSWDCHAMHK